MHLLERMPPTLNFVQSVTKVDLEKSLASLTEAMEPLNTKDTPAHQGTDAPPASAGGDQETGMGAKVLVELR